MTLFLIRDDDANATTDPDWLARAYAPLFDSGIAVCFAVIPRVALDVRDPQGHREKFLAPDVPDRPAVREVGPETALCSWLREHEEAADVFVHGLTHERVRDGTEFGALSRPEAEVRLSEARRLVTTAIGRVPLGFVAPWDEVSRGALDAIVASFDLFSTGFVDRRRLPPRAWAEHVRERIGRTGALRVGRSWVLRHSGCRITGGTRADEVAGIVRDLGRHARVTVLVLHHWHFGPTSQPSPTIRALASALRGQRTGRIRDVLHELDERALVF